MIMYGYGLDYFENYPNDMTPVINTQEWVDAVKRFARLMTKYGPSGVESFYYEDIALVVQQGGVGIWIDGAPLIAVYDNPEVSKSHGEIGFSVCPAGPAGAFPPNTSHYWTMNPNAKNKDLAWEFIKFATSKEILLAQATGEYKNPLIANPRSSVYNDATFKEQNNYDYGYGTWAQAFNDSLAIANPRYIPPIEEFPEMAEIISAAISSVMAGADAQKELDSAQDQLYDILEEAGYFD
jgi:ABC-type glycerol-3-phosphate transport system substrate-binding protein